MSIRKIGLISLLAGLLTVGTAVNVTTVSSVHAQVAAANQGKGNSYFCSKPQHKKFKICAKKGGGVSTPHIAATGGGGTAPNAGTAASVGGVVMNHGLPYAVSGATGAVNGSTGVHSLPSTGGGVPSSPNNPWLALILAAMALMAGGVALRANSRR